ncbi:putative cytochrome P450 E-class, group I [Triangularia setosa]|uniref:Cytochrome P450 E-class, group I n=1 Tax=Triangularia setosa TaxID=2587417 RepID=A0AAN7A4G5_9PEZI|nr:putative cytochrome P450 E-class, group I [Podospora setosa]
MSDIKFSLLLSLLELTTYHLTNHSLPILPPSHLTAQLLPLFLIHYPPLKLYCLFVYPFYFSPLRNIPTPSNDHPLLGQTLHLLRATSPVQTYVNYANAFPTLLVCSPQAHKEVLQTHCYKFKKPEIMYRFIGDSTRRGLLFAEGEKHKLTRRRLNGIFGPGRGNLVNGLYVKATIDVTGATILGVDLGNLRDKTINMDFLSSFRRSRIHELSQQPNYHNPVSNRADLLTMIMQGEISLTRREDDRGRNNKRIPPSPLPLFQPPLTNPLNSSQLLTFLAAGHETTTNALLWATYILAVQLQIQTSPRASLSSLFFSNNGHLPTYSNLTSTLTSTTSPAKSSAESLSDLTICNTFIPRGTTLLLLPFAMIEFKALLVELMSKFEFGMTEELEKLNGREMETANPGVG